MKIFGIYDNISKNDMSYHEHTRDYIRKNIK
jgi:hypothetical protein